jgi:hypothetical protein
MGRAAAAGEGKARRAQNRNRGFIILRERIIPEPKA